MENLDDKNYELLEKEIFKGDKEYKTSKWKYYL